MKEPGFIEYFLVFLIYCGPPLLWVFTFAYTSGLLARQRRRSFWGWFTVGAFLGPFGWIVALMDPVYDNDELALLVEFNLKRTIPRARVRPLGDDFAVTTPQQGRRVINRSSAIRYVRGFDV